MVPLALTVPEEHCVLVVEDNITIRFLLAEHLRDAGLQVVEARCAADALSYVEAGGRLDLLLTDVEMPGPMDGLMLAGSMRAAFPSLPIVVTSGNAAHAAAVKTGIFLAKPYSMRKFVARVLALLNIERPA